MCLPKLFAGRPFILLIKMSFATREKTVKTWTLYLSLFRVNQELIVYMLCYLQTVFWCLPISSLSPEYYPIHSDVHTAYYHHEMFSGKITPKARTKPYVCIWRKNKTDLLCCFLVSCSSLICCSFCSSN